MEISFSKDMRIKRIVQSTKSFCYTITDHHNLILAFMEHMVLVLCIYYPWFGLMFMSLVSIYDRLMRRYLRHKVPVRVTTVCVGFTRVGWFVVTIFNQLLLELTKTTVLLGLLTIGIQYYYYRGNPAKQYKSVPSNVIFIMASLVVEIMNQYNLALYEKKYNTIYLEKVIKYGKSDSEPKLRNTILSRCRYGDYYKVSFNNIPVNSELYSINTNRYLRVNMVKVTGEDKPVSKATQILKTNPNSKRNRRSNVFSYEELKSNSCVVPADSEIIGDTSNLYGKIIKVDGQPQTNPSIPELMQIVENIKKIFICIGIVNFVMIAAIDYATASSGNNRLYNLSKILQYFLPSQMMVPLSFNAVIIVIYSIVYKFGLLRTLKRLPINVYERLPEIRNRFLVTDKTGTLTIQGFRVRDIVSYNSWIADLKTKYILSFLADSDTSEPEEITMTKYLKDKYDYQYTILSHNGNEIVKSINNKTYITHNLGLFYSIGGTLTFVQRNQDHKEESFIVYQGCPNNRLRLLVPADQRELIKDFQQVRDATGIGYENPTRDWVHGQIGLDGSGVTVKCIPDITINKETTERDILEFLTRRGIFDRFRLYEGFVMDNPLRKSAREAIQSFNGAHNAIICTGDNTQNSLLVAKCVGQYIDDAIMVNEKTKLDCIRENATYIFEKTTHIDYLDTILDSDRNTYIVFAACTPNDKLVVVNRLKSRGLNVLFTGDGVNDTLAMRAAHLSVCFPTGNCSPTGDDGREFLEQPKSVASATTWDFTDNNFWEDWANSVYDLDKNRIRECAATLLHMLIMKGYARSSLQLGSLFARGKIIDPVPGIWMDNIFDVIILLLWISVPIYRHFVLEKTKLTRSQHWSYRGFICTGIFSYTICTTLSYLTYSFLQTSWAAAINLAFIIIMQIKFIQ